MSLAGLLGLCLPEASGLGSTAGDEAAGRLAPAAACQELPLLPAVLMSMRAEGKHRDWWAGEMICVIGFLHGVRFKLLHPLHNSSQQMIHVEIVMDCDGLCVFALLFCSLLCCAACICSRLGVMDHLVVPNPYTQTLFIKGPCLDTCNFRGNSPLFYLSNLVSSLQVPTFQQHAKMCAGGELLLSVEDFSKQFLVMFTSSPVLLANHHHHIIIIMMHTLKFRFPSHQAVQ